jgi:hypothetical protein
MKLRLDRPDVLALTGQFPELDKLQDQLRFGHRVELGSHTLPTEALEFLAGLYETAGAWLAAPRNCVAWWPRAVASCPRSSSNKAWRPCFPHW